MADVPGGFLIPRRIVVELVGGLVADGLVYKPDALARYYRRLYNRKRTQERRGYDRRARRNRWARG